MRALATVRQLLSRVRVAPEATPEAAPRARVRRRKVAKGHVVPEAPPRPALAAQASRFVQIEREVLQRFRPLMLQAIQDELHALAAAQGQADRPVCCGRPMGHHDSPRTGWLVWVGRVGIRAWRYRCGLCGAERYPLLESLEVEPGQPSGMLARMLGLLGCVAPYPLAAEMCARLLGIEVNAMTVWRAVQRLGEAAARHSEALSSYHADSRSEANESACPPDVVVAAMDGCLLGMQVRSKRRRRRSPEEVLPPLPPVEDGQFREVKTGVILLPTDRVPLSPERRALVRRVLVSCLGTADAIVSRLWAELRERGWAGPETLIVLIGDGAEWIWNRATLFANRCEILDFWHAMEYAWNYARLQFGEGSRRADKWTARLASDLKAGKVLAVIERLKTLAPTSKESREALDALIKYYTDNASRMRYDEYLRLGYGIGSGSVESAHKQVVHARLRQAGMRWSLAGARRLLALRLLLLNGNWAMTDQLRMVRFAA
jgi:hypothetical protein